MFLLNRRKRALYLSSHRSMKEADKIMGDFSSQFLETFTEDQLRKFESLLDQNDLMIFDWLYGRSKVPKEFDHDVFHMLKNFVTAFNKVAKL